MQEWKVNFSVKFSKISAGWICLHNFLTDMEFFLSRIRGWWANSLRVHIYLSTLKHSCYSTWVFMLELPLKLILAWNSLSQSCNGVPACLLQIFACIYILNDTVLSDSFLHSILRMYVLYTQFTSIYMYMPMELYSFLWKDTNCYKLAYCAANTACDFSVVNGPMNRPIDYCCLIFAFLFSII